MAITRLPSPRPSPRCPSLRLRGPPSRTLLGNTNLGGRIDALRVELKEELRSESGALRTELKAGIGQTNARLDQTNAKLDHTNERLDTVDTTLQELAAQQVMLGRYVKHTSQRAIDELRAR